MPYSTEAIQAACDLRNFLNDRGRLRSNASTLGLDAGEVEYTVMPVDLWRYAAGDPTYHRPGIYGPQEQQLIFGMLHDAAERSVREKARPRWRLVDGGDLHVTNRRALLLSQLGPPTSWWLGNVLDVKLWDSGVYMAWDGGMATFAAHDQSPYLYVLLHYLAYDRLPDISDLRMNGSGRSDGGGPGASALLSGKVQRQVQRAGVGRVAGGTGNLLDELVLVVNQIEATNEYVVYDQHGYQLGAVIEVGRTARRELLRALTSFDKFLRHRFEVRDQHGRTVLSVVRQPKSFTSTVVVSRPGGAEIGRIRQENVSGKIRFALEVNGQRIGGIKAESWRARNFAIVDAANREIARITKTGEGLAKKIISTTVANYVLQIHDRLDEPLRSLVVASALTIEIALK